MKQAIILLLITASTALSYADNISFDFPPLGVVSDYVVLKASVFACNKQILKETKKM